MSDHANSGWRLYYSAQREIDRLRKALDLAIAVQHKTHRENRDVKARLREVRRVTAGRDDFRGWLNVARATDLRVKAWRKP